MFISKATPGDDEFVLWLAPRLEAAGYNVFADILSLEPGDRWRKHVTYTLQENAAKLLLCCSDATLDKNGVQEEIGIAEDLIARATLYSAKLRTAIGPVDLNSTKGLLGLRIQLAIRVTFGAVGENIDGRRGIRRCWRRH